MDIWEMVGTMMGISFFWVVDVYIFHCMFSMWISWCIMRVRDNTKVHHSKPDTIHIINNNSLSILSIYINHIRVYIIPQCCFSFCWLKAPSSPVSSKSPSFGFPSFQLILAPPARCACRFPGCDCRGRGAWRDVAEPRAPQGPGLRSR